MKVKVHISLKNGVLDPQGRAVQHALGALGFKGVENVPLTDDHSVVITS